MAFCSHCGKELPDQAQFCMFCGASVADGRRITVFQGKIKKCPNCGENAGSFSIKCPTCGFEFRDVGVSSSIQTFSSRLSASLSLSEREAIIRDFLVPNTKEDITEFLILASSNIRTAENDGIFEAWNSKIVQCYRKAEISFNGDEDFESIKSIYNEAVSYAKRTRNIKTAKKAGAYALNAATDIPQAILSGAWVVTLIVLLPLCNMNLDSNGQNGYHVFYIFICIVGAVGLPYVLDCKSSLPKTIFLIGVIVTVVILVPLTHTYEDYTGAMLPLIPV